jgi:single-strand DNA-binding protein
MNSVSLIGRLTKDPDIRYGAESQTAVARFSIAIDRGKDKNGESRGTDFPNIVCFGKTAELVERFVSKGRLVGIQGRIQTGKYEKDGRTVYTTEVLADRVEFLDWGDKNEGGGAQQTAGSSKSASDVPEGFGALTDDDIPF